MEVIMNDNYMVYVELSSNDVAYHQYTQDDVDTKTIIRATTDESHWKIIAVRTNTLTGFYGVAHENVDTQEVVVALRGTSLTDGGDIATGLQIGIGSIVTHGTNIPNQFRDAYDFYNTVSNYATESGLYKPIVAGHSLAGSLSQLIGAITGAEAYSINGPRSLTL